MPSLQKRLRRCIFVVACVGLVLPASAGVTPYDLRCEYRAEALGIDTAVPRFSWKMADDSHTRGQKQTGYRILVASGLDNMNAGNGDLWDANVTSDQSVNIDYGGVALSCGMECWWKVQVRDKGGASSPWSVPARFSVGPLKPGDWTGSWIGMSSALDNDCPWFRKTFSLTTVPASAFIHVASAGYHEVYVNGQRAGDAVLSPSPSYYAKRVLFSTYDIKPLLKAGQNTVGVWIDGGWARFSDGGYMFTMPKRPMFIGQIDMRATDGAATRIATDATWKCRLSTTRHIGGWEWLDYGGEAVDMRNDVPGWSTPEIAETGWSNATTYSLSATISSDLCTPNRICDTINASTVSGTATSCRITMEEAYAGWIQVNLQGSPGSTATISISTDDGPAQWNQVHTYTFDNTGKGIFRNRFSYQEVLYVTISGITARPALTDIKGFRVGNDLPRTGEFDCSNALMKKIYDYTLNNILNLTTGGYTADCPHREKFGYGGDGLTGVESALNNFEMGALYTNWIMHWRDVQRTDGDLPNAAPIIFTTGGGGPAWSGFIITMPWEFYQTYGDLRILAKTYPAMKKWMALLETKDDANSIMQPFGFDSPGWDFLGDYGSVNDNQGGDQGILLLNNLYYLYEARIMSKIAAILGSSSESSAYASKAAAIKAGILARFYDTGTRRFYDSRQVDIAFPLIAGAVPDADVAAVIQNLENAVNAKKHFDTGLFGTLFVTKCLTEIDRSDLMYTLASPTDHPSYGYFVSRGLKTWPEMWDMSYAGGVSLMHGLYNGIGAWFQEGLAGIRFDPDNPGFRHAIIAPSNVGGITSARGEVGTMYGKIVSDWKSVYGTSPSFTLAIEVPPNTTAEVHFPSGDTARIWEGATHAWKSTGVAFDRVENGKCVFTVQSGTYAFSSTGPVLATSDGIEDRLRGGMRVSAHAGRLHVLNPFPAPARITVLDMAGRVVAEIPAVKSGRPVVLGRGSAPLASGAYHVRVESRGQVVTRRATVVCR